MSYDVFISHSSYDKDEVVRPLTLALQARDLRVWLDEQQMNVGDSIRGSIESALQKSRFGVVILSPAYKGSAWGKQELSALFAKEKYQDKVILPIYHGVTIEDVEEHWPLLADKISLNALAGSDELADKIYQSILQSDDKSHRRKKPVEPVKPNWFNRHWKWFFGILAAVLLIITPFISPFFSTRVSPKNEQEKSDSRQQVIPENLEKKLRTYEDITNSDPENIEAWNELGHIHKALGYLGESTKAYNRVLNLAGEGTIWYAVANGNLGNIYRKRNQSYKAKKYFEISLNTSQSIDWQIGIALSVGNLALVYNDLNQLDKAEEYYRKAINIHKDMGDQKGIALQSGNLGLFFMEVNKLDKADYYIKGALKIYQNLNDQKGIASQYKFLGKLYELRDDIDTACQYWQDSFKVLSKLEPVEAQHLQEILDRDCSGKTSSINNSADIPLVKNPKIENKRSFPVKLTSSQLNLFLKIGFYKKTSKMMEGGEGEDLIVLSEKKLIEIKHEKKIGAGFSQVNILNLGEELYNLIIKYIASEVQFSFGYLSIKEIKFITTYMDRGLGGFKSPDQINKAALSELIEHALFEYNKENDNYIPTSLGKEVAHQIFIIIHDEFT